MLPTPLQEVVSRLPLVTPGEFNAAVQSAKDAFPAWRRTPVPHRARVMLKLQVRCCVLLVDQTQRSKRNSFAAPHL